jgi:predicted  nucleic acid-binding Zn-ribbon protein
MIHNKNLMKLKHFRVYKPNIGGMNMELTLKSYPVFVDYENKMDEKKRILNERVKANQLAIDALKKEYADLFAADTDTSKVAAKLKKLNEEAAGLQAEVEVVAATDLKQYELADKVHDEYEELMKKVREEQHKLSLEIENVVKRAKEEVANLEKRHHDLSTRFNVDVANGQFRNIIDNLNISDEAKRTLYSRVENHPVGYGSFRNLFA